MRAHCSVRLSGSISRNWVTPCGRFITGKPMSHLMRGRVALRMRARAKAEGEGGAAGKALMVG